ncbi:MAG: GGDEF domain-containing protein [Pseudomonadota bacterium]
MPTVHAHEPLDRPPRVDLTEDLVRLGGLCSIMAAGAAPRAVLPLALGLLRELSGGRATALLVEERVVAALGSPLERSLGLVELEGHARLLCGGPEADGIRDWAGSSAPVVSLEGADLILPTRRGGVKVSEPISGVLADANRSAVLHLLADLCQGLASWAADLAEADQRSSSLEETRLRFQEQNMLLRELAVVDELTGLRNRRFFDGRLQYELDRVERYRNPLALALLDIDHFKAVNDTWGHAAGDVILHELAVLALRQVRRVDLLARVGGEEFALLMPDTEEGGARTVCTRLLEGVRDTVFHVGGREVGLTVSMGLAVALPGWEGDPARLFRAADQALYRAKLDGRDRIVVASQAG